MFKSKMEYNGHSSVDINNNMPLFFSVHVDIIQINHSTENTDISEICIMGDEHLGWTPWDDLSYSDRLIHAAFQTTHKKKDK